jgi:hypothetical protein
MGRQDAVDALAFCEALLDYLYVLTAKFREFEERRKADKGGTAERPAP